MNVFINLCVAFGNEELLFIWIYRNMFLFGRGLVVVHICSQLILFISVNSQGQAKTIKLDLYKKQNQTATKSKTKEIQRTYMLLFVHTLVDVAVYQLYRAVWKLESYSVLETWRCKHLLVFTYLEIETTALCLTF